MKYIIKSILFSCLAVFLLVSCLSSEDSEKYPYCAIATFAVNDISSTVESQTKVISGSDIFFRIDQTTDSIQNVDSLPSWTDLTKVVPSFTAYGSVNLVYEDSLLYTLTTDVDTLNLSSPVVLKVVSTDGLYSRDYTLSIVKKSGVSNALAWDSIVNNLELVGDYRPVVLEEKVFLFVKDKDGNSFVTSATEPASWSVPQAVADTINITTTIAHADSLYALSNKGYLCKSADGCKWTVKDETKCLQKFLASDGVNIFSFDGKSIVYLTSKGWRIDSESDVNMLPDSCIYNLQYVSNTNDSIRISMMGGISVGNKVNTVCWYKVSHEDEDINEPWAYMAVTMDNNFALPRLNNLSITRYGEELLAVGMNDEKTNFNNVDNTETAQKAVGIYRSRDNGLTWFKDDGNTWGLPKSLYAVNGAANMVVVDDKIWLIQSNGAIWTGMMR